MFWYLTLHTPNSSSPFRYSFHSWAQIPCISLSILCSFWPQYFVLNVPSPWNIVFTKCHVIPENLLFLRTHLMSLPLQSLPSPLWVSVSTSFCAFPCLLPLTELSTQFVHLVVDMTVTATSCEPHGGHKSSSFQFVSQCLTLCLALRRWLIYVCCMRRDQNWRKEREGQGWIWTFHIEKRNLEIIGRNSWL